MHKQLHFAANELEEMIFHARVTSIKRNVSQLYEAPTPRAVVEIDKLRCSKKEKHESRKTSFS